MPNYIYSLRKITLSQLALREIFFSKLKTVKYNLPKGIYRQWWHHTGKKELGC